MVSYETKLPVINLSEDNMEPSAVSWSSTSEAVCQALEEYGCFVAIHETKTSLELSNAIFRASEELFDLPLERKALNVSDKVGFGYYGNLTSLPLFEASGLENGGSVEVIRSFANLMWPSGNDHFCETATEFSELLSGLGKAVMRMVLERYGVDKYYESLKFIEMLRFMKYRPARANETDLGLNPHTDKGFLAVLHTNQVKGLEIETKEGQWIGFDPSPSSFVVITGDVFMAWTNGRTHTPLHRVVREGSATKYTIAMFWFMRDVVQAAEELIDEQHPLRFKPFNQFEFLDYVLKVGKDFKDPINAYCGLLS